MFGIALDVPELVKSSDARPISQDQEQRRFALQRPHCANPFLADVMDLPVADSRPETRLLIVTEVNGTIVALEVDAIRERLEVVLKPMQGLLSNARGYSGTALLGDGEVLLVLDLREILP